MAERFQQESVNFRLLGHDQEAAWGCGSLCDIYKGHAFVGSVGGSSGFAPEGFTVSDVTDPRRPRAGRYPHRHGAQRRSTPRAHGGTPPRTSAGSRRPLVPGHRSGM